MQLQNPSNYALYIKEKTGQNVIEKDYGFVTYSHTDGIVWISAIFIVKEHRMSKKGVSLIEEIIKETKCKEIRSNVIVGQFVLEEAVMAHLKYGFSICDAQNGKIYFRKEVTNE